MTTAVRRLSAAFRPAALSRAALGAVQPDDPKLLLTTRNKQESPPSGVLTASFVYSLSLFDPAKVDFVQNE